MAGGYVCSTAAWPHRANKSIQAKALRGATKLRPTWLVDPQERELAR